MKSKNRSIQLSRIFIENGSNFFPFWRLLKKRSVNDFILASYMLSHPNPTQQCGETHCYMIFHSDFDWKHSALQKTWVTNWWAYLATLISSCARKSACWGLRRSSLTSSSKDKEQVQRAKLHILFPWEQAFLRSNAKCSQNCDSGVDFQ